MKNLLIVCMLMVLGMTAANAQTNTISGNIVLDSNKWSHGHDSFEVWLITFDTSANTLTAVDSQYVMIFQGYTGSYSFSGYAAGQYRVKAAWGPASPKNVPGPLPTYQDSSALWSSANVINHTGTTSTGNHIYMRFGTVPQGPGFVGGNVLQGANKGTANGIANMNVLLLDQNNNPVTYVTTDANGDFSFNNLPYGTYKIHPENLGDITTPISVTIDANTPSVNNIDFERSSSNKTIMGLGLNVGALAVHKTGNVYPNPASGVVHINWSRLSGDMATVIITDVSGKVVATSEKKMNADAVINIGGMSPGVYFLHLNTTHGRDTHKIFVQ